MKIFVVENNFTEKTLAGKPNVIFKPDSTLLKSNKPFYIPEFSDEIWAQIFPVFLVGKLGKNIGIRFAERYFSEIGVGICFTAKDMEKSGSLSYVFDYSTVVSNFFSKEKFDLQNIDFQLFINNKKMQEGKIGALEFSPVELITHVSSYCTIKTGDLFFAGTPDEGAKICTGDRVTAFLSGEKLIDMQIK
jgi:2-keto-4-pentenoate hydratase/2-oxohepta-3-ene-1,7-dioic acid hydratase in catechol pathway